MDIIMHILEKKPRTIGIEGMFGSGKTTFAKNLAKRIDGIVLPIDLFHKKERIFWNTKTDLADFEDLDRVAKVIEKIKKGKKFALENVYNHVDGRFTKSVEIEPKEFIVVEGLFAMNLDLDFKIFLDPDPKVALARGKERDIKERNLTEEQWAIKKHLFHDEYLKFAPMLKKKADMIIDTTNSFPEF